MHTSLNLFSEFGTMDIDTIADNSEKLVNDKEDVGMVESKPSINGNIVKSMPLKKQPGNVHPFSQSEKRGLH